MLHFSLCSFGELTCFSRENPRHVRACTEQRVISWYHQLSSLSLTEYMTYSVFINQTRPESILGLNSTIEHSRRFTQRWSISSSTAFLSPSISIFLAGFCLNFFMTIASFFVLYMSVKIKRNACWFQNASFLCLFVCQQPELNLIISWERQKNCITNYQMSNREVNCTLHDKKTILHLHFLFFTFLIMGK